MKRLQKKDPQGEEKMRHFKAVTTSDRAVRLAIQLDTQPESKTEVKGLPLAILIGLTLKGGKPQS